MNKQIDEMVKIINKPCFKIMEEAGATDRDCPFPYSCEECSATNLYKAGYRRQEDVAREIIQIAKNGAEKYIEDITLNEGIRNMLSIMLDDFITELKKKYGVTEE